MMRFRRGQVLKADDLNKVVGMIPRAGPGVSLQTGPTGSVITSTKNRVAPFREFDALIVSSTEVAARQWSYQIAEAIKTQPGYGGWQVRTGGRTGTAYNRYEEINGGTVVGNGVEVVNIPAGWSIRPIPNGLPVRITASHIFQYTGPGDIVNHGLEYWFAVINGVDGVCEAAP